jgi:hypothetical protein
LLFVEILPVKKKGHGTCNLQLFPPSFSLENTKKLKIKIKLKIKLKIKKIVWKIDT